jgi:hypothetical protein
MLLCLTIIVDDGQTSEILGDGDFAPSSDDSKQKRITGGMMNMVLGQQVSKQVEVFLTSARCDLVDQIKHLTHQSVYAGKHHLIVECTEVRHELIPNAPVDLEPKVIAHPVFHPHDTVRGFKHLFPMLPERAAWREQIHMILPW